MRAIPKAPPWEATLADLKHQYATADEQGREVLQRKIFNLEKAIAIRDGLSATATPRGKMEFSL